MFQDRRQNRVRALGALRPEVVRPLLDAPAVVAAFLDEMDALPQVLADTAVPEVAVLGVEAHLPRLAQAVSPDLRPGGAAVHEGVVLRDGVEPGIVHIDAQDLAAHIAKVLGGLVPVRDAAAVAGADVEHAVGAELEAAGVVAAGRPPEQDPLARRVGLWRAAPFLEFAHARAARVL